ncbi:MAG: COX15/CtaA family protein [Bacteroidota bacterium]
MIKFQKLTILSIIVVYLVILAGSVVRMTGSGMGCPDWPKCFGYLIPPSERSQLDWKPNFQFNKDQIIIIDEQLYYAPESFESKDIFESKNWKKYTKHDYAKFDPVHTWIEYINRLIGAIAGIIVLILFLSSLRFIGKKSLITLLSFLSLLAILFQAWLGKTVVDSNLEANTITIHMFMAILLLFILFSILAFSKKSKSNYKIPKIVYSLILISLLTIIFQVFTGTEVRKFIDIKMELFNYLQKDKWIENIPNIFYTHRSFSWIILLSNALAFYLLSKLKLKSIILSYTNILILIQIITGVIMYYFYFPFASQPIHLLLSTIIVGLQFYFLIINRNIFNETKT